MAAESDLDLIQGMLCALLWCKPNRALGEQMAAAARTDALPDAARALLDGVKAIPNPPLTDDARRTLARARRRARAILATENEGKSE